MQVQGRKKSSFIEELHSSNLDDDCSQPDKSEEPPILGYSQNFHFSIDQIDSDQIDSITMPSKNDFPAHQRDVAANLANMNAHNVLNTMTQTLSRNKDQVSIINTKMEDFSYRRWYKRNTTLSASIFASNKLSPKHWTYGKVFSGRFQGPPRARGSYRNIIEWWRVSRLA